jgi:hypothetical protein
MKKLCLFIVSVCFLQISTSAQVFETAKQVYESPKLKTEISKHKVIAILPFKATISYKRIPKNYDTAANQAGGTKPVNRNAGGYVHLYVEKGERLFS